MGKVNLTLQPEIDNDAVDRVRKTLVKMGPYDELSISIESADAHQADRIFSCLDESGYQYQSRGSHDGKTYLINARMKPN
ncbi:hypothetical protein SAMN05660649_02282 [Desulfotomaculum arcticum]|uniref:Uncharacterized protein n=1 Tax=Desulfotruncus arcticus DSM 17038 TaxID=1121424 RepID=A0A1I2TIL1_9FIRM|nr:hypothetical protein [Desulfotruncus arcticus]SFG64735.1 hypothetical protein SAMN05660649_02282 [Desulfotomaculum arcticum] [Desulfotruncus arcticus DSM 17038]